MADKDGTSWLWVPVQPKSLPASNDPNRNLGKRTMWVSADSYRPPPADSPIIPIWQSTIIPAAVSIIDENKVPMTSLNFIQRLQPEGETSIGEKGYDPSTVLWIGVEEGEMTPEQAEDLLAQCSDMLKAHSVEDVRVEVHASPVVLHGGPHFLSEPRIWRDISRFELPFHLGIGWPLSSPAKGAAGGTGGVFVKLGEQPATYLLSARHPFNGGNTLVHPSDPMEPGNDILLMGNQHFLDHLDLIDRELKETACKIDTRKRMLTRSGKYDSEDIECIASEMKGLDYDQRGLKTLYSKLQAEWSREDDRRLGAVSHCSRDASDSTTTHLEDWALIRLNDNIVPDGVSPNVLRLGQRVPFMSGFTLDPNIEAYLPVQVTSMVPISEFEGRQTPCLKYGTVGDVKIGIIHPVYALFRSKTGHGTHDTLVMTISASAAKEKKFSGPGDSGSIVIGEKGGAVAMVIGGVSQLRVTYASPLEQIFESIEKFTGLKPRLA
jgi:hypothetical protein